MYIPSVIVHMTALSTAGCAPVTGTRSHCEQGHRSTKRRHLIINPRGAWQRGREWRDLAKVSFPHFLIKNTDSFLHLRKHHIYFAWISRVWDFPGGSDGKTSAYNAGDPGSISGSGRSPGEESGNPFQYSCLENPMHGGAWEATVHGVSKSQTLLHFSRV